MIAPSWLKECQVAWYSAGDEGEVLARPTPLPLPPLLPLLLSRRPRVCLHPPPNLAHSRYSAILFPHSATSTQTNKHTLNWIVHMRDGRAQLPRVAMSVPLSLAYSTPFVGHSHSPHKRHTNR